MTIKAIIWDLGGVLVRTEDWEPRDELAARLGTDRLTLINTVFGDDGDYRAQIGEITTAEQWADVAKRLNIPAEEIPAVKTAFFAGDMLDTELIDTIRRFKANYTTALLSNAMDDLRREIFENWKINDAFDHLVISAEVGVKKPDQRIYELTLEKVGVAPQEAVFIDDMPENIAAAKAVGMHGIRFVSKAQALADLEALLKQ
ncbi:MAG: HAD family phosphatase [Anaerolineales bacterium]|nr:HAD family phosphatase [Anaerolineales bacterium]